MSEITSITVVVPVTNLTDEIATIRAKLAAAEARVAEARAERYRAGMRDTCAVLGGDPQRNTCRRGGEMMATFPTLEEKYADIYASRRDAGIWLTFVRWARQVTT